MQEFPGLTREEGSTEAYAITLTLRPIWYKKTIEEQAKLIKDELFRLHGVRRLSLSLVLEYTKAYNIHSHGVIKKHNINKLSELRQLNDIFRGNKFIGFVCMKPVTDIYKWRDYIEKSRDLMIKDLGYHSIIDDFNLFTSLSNYGIVECKADGPARARGESADQKPTHKHIEDLSMGRAPATAGDSLTFKIATSLLCCGHESDANIK